MKIITILFLSLFIFTVTLLSQTRVDFTLSIPDGTILDCTKYIPEGSPPPAGWPCIILTHGYGLSKESELKFAEGFANDDFYSLTYSMRGQGNSTGQSYFISIVEANDLMQIVNYIRNDANTDDNNIAVHGGSQGGIIPFMAACNGMNVKTILPDFASPQHATSWIENGSIKITFLWTLGYTPANVRYHPSVALFRTWALSDSTDKWDSLALYVPQTRDFLDRVNMCQTQVLGCNVWQDLFFNTYGMIQSAYILPYNNYRFYWGTFDGHGGDPDDDEIDFQSNLVVDWLDYHLKGINNGVTNADQKFTYASSMYPTHSGGDYWTWERFYSPVWPPAGTQNVRLYFHPNSLQSYPYSGGTASVTLNNTVNSSLTMQTAVNYEFTGSTFNALFQKHTLTFNSPPMLQDARLVGTPLVKLFYSSTASVSQYNFQIYDVQGNTEKLVTRANWTDRHNIPNQVRQQEFLGQSYSHIFQAGHRIRVKLTNLDNVTYHWFLRTNPHVLPVLKNGQNKMYVNNNSQSYIELPMLNFVIGINPISTLVPDKFSLSQNYPNPFNPATKFKFQIAKLSNVKINVYDITGRQVATIIDKQLQPGTYEADFDGSSFTSGIYFYRMIGDGFIETKKMILIK